MQKQYKIVLVTIVIYLETIENLGKGYFKKPVREEWPYLLERRAEHKMDLGGGMISLSISQFIDYYDVKHELTRRENGKL